MDSQKIVDAKWLRQHRDDANVMLVDTRPAKDFHAGHLSGARHFDPFPFHHTDTSPRGAPQGRAPFRSVPVPSYGYAPARNRGVRCPAAVNIFAAGNPRDPEPF